MAKSLPARPHLDHLRRQAKSLLASLAAGDADAIATLQEFLPAARGMSSGQVRSAGFRLADAQSAVARKSGFAGWPQLSRHVELLRALEGSWSFERLEIDGTVLPAAAMQSSRLLIDGDRFRTESPEGTYEGEFTIDVEAQPHQIHIEFVEGPEAGNWNHGIFRLEGDALELCLDVNGKPCPGAFATSRGSGHALETLRRVTGERPESVKGGDRSAQSRKVAAECGEAAGAADESGFRGAPTPTLSRLQGDWSALQLVRDGKELPSTLLGMGRRIAHGNEIKISFGGQVIIHALVRVNEGTRPLEIDYFNLAGPAKGKIQAGIMEWLGDVACFCMGAPGGDRPSDFSCAEGSGRTLSRWRLNAGK